MRLRKAEEAAFQERQLIAAQMKQRNKDAAAAIAAHKAAVAELNKTKRKLQELESARQCKHAVKTFTLVALGEGSPNAGGAKARKNRHEVLDRLSRLNTGLSDEQRNDFAWWKDAWDEATVKQHGANWAATFAGWVTNILDSTDPTAFTNFVYKETVRAPQCQHSVSCPRRLSEQLSSAVAGSTVPPQSRVLLRLVSLAAHHGESARPTCGFRFLGNRSRGFHSYSLILLSPHGRVLRGRSRDSAGHAYKTTCAVFNFLCN